MFLSGNTNSKKGFTLIELLVVVAIISLLASVVLASLNSARAKARDSKRKQEMTQLRTALELYANDHNGSYPPSATTYWVGYGTATCSPGFQGTLTGATGYIPNLAPTYISKLPVDPSGLTAVCTGYQYYSDGTQYGILDHGTPESYSGTGTPPNGCSNTSDPFCDPARPNWAWKLCYGAAACAL